MYSKLLINLLKKTTLNNNFLEKNVETTSVHMRIIATKKTKTEFFGR